MARGLGSVLLVLLLAVAGASAPQAATLPPNVVIILTDDQPAFDGRLMNYMPNTKALFVDQGITFSDFHSSTPLCCPSRASFLTGEYTHNHGVTENKAALFDPRMTLATQLHTVGYRTLLVGKYMNLYGSCNEQNCAPNVPPGWDYFAAFGNPSYYDYELWINGVSRSYGSSPADYSTDVIRDLAVQALRSSPANSPVFAWIAPFAPHSPQTPAPRHQGVPCSGGARWNPPDYNELDVSDKPAYIRALPLLSPPKPNAPTCRPLLAVDDLVAAVRNELSSEGRLANTIFVYSGDNGMNRGEHRLSGKNSPYVTNIPFYVHWPKVAEPRTIAEKLQNIDLAPTICELLACTLGPYPNGQRTPDGLSFAPLLLGTKVTLGRDALLDELPHTNEGIPAWYSVATTPASSLGLWQYTEYATSEKELYDVSHGPCWRWSIGQPGDPCELVNQVTNPAYASLVTKLHDRLVQLKNQHGR